MNWYVKDWGRPIGVESVIYSYEPPDPLDDESPFWPTTVKFNSKEEAEIFVKERTKDEILYSYDNSYIIKERLGIK